MQWQDTERNTANVLFPILGSQKKNNPGPGVDGRATFLAF